MSEVCYQPPTGYVDEFYMFVFDAFQNNLSDGNTFLNQAVYIPGGFDFVLRRIVGVDSVLSPVTGKFQWRGSNQVNTSTAPVVGNPTLRDQLIVPEVFFPRQSQITFDLYNVLQRYVLGQNDDPDPATFVRMIQAQIGFAGVRRRRSGPMPTPGNFKRVPFQTTLTIPTYIQTALTTAPNGTLFGPQSLGIQKTFQLTIQNYDVEIHMIQCVDVNPAAAPGAGTIPNGLNYFAIIPYDAAKNALTSGYVLSQYISDAIPFGTPSVGSINSMQDPTLASPTLYGMGAIAPPLVYPQQTEIRVDVTSLIGNCAVPYDWQVGGNLVMTFTGFQRIPC